MTFRTSSVLKLAITLALGFVLGACTDPLKKNQLASEAKPGQAFVGINSISPTGGPLSGGTRVRILGTGFSVDAKVKLGGVDCASVTWVSIDEVDCNVASHASTEAVDVVVTNPNGTFATLAGGFTYRPPPTITSVSPALGKSTGGTAITIAGTGFVEGMAVSFDTSACDSVVIVSATQATCVTSAHAVALVDVSVTNVDGQFATKTGAFDYRLAPIIASIAPTGGDLPGGTMITITGSSFVSGVTVSLGGSNCGSLTFVNSTTLTCVTPAHAAGAVTVIATNTNTMTGSLSNAFTYRSAPTVTAISPAIGALAGGTTVTITGTGFYSGITAKIDGVACGTPTYVSATSMTCVTPGPHTQALVGIAITNLDSQTASLAGAYNYMDPPSAPSSLVAVAKSERSVLLTWNDNSNNEGEFRIERSTDNVTFTQIVATAANATSYTDTGLTTDQIYYYRVRAYNLAANSAYTNVASATPIGVHLEVPIELLDIGITASTSSIAWERSRTSLNTTDYDGTITYVFAAVCANTSAGSLNLSLLDGTGAAKATLTIAANAGVVTRYETTWTPTAGASDYRIQTPAVASGALTCHTARILVQQANATKTKLYIPLVGDLYNNSDSDNSILGASIDETSSSTYGQQVPGHYSIWKKDTSRYADLDATSPWTFEVVMASETATARAAIFNRSTGLMVTGSEISQSTTTPTMYNITFADNATNFTNLDNFEVRLRKSGGGGFNITHLFKAGLWVKLTNLNKADIYYRNARYVNTSASLAVPHSRVKLDMTKFLNIISPVVTHQVVGSEATVGSSDISMRSTNTSDSVTTGTDLSSSILDFNSVTDTILTSGANTIVSGERFIPYIRVTTGSVQLKSSFVIVTIQK